MSDDDIPKTPTHDNYQGDMYVPATPGTPTSGVNGQRDNPMNEERPMTTPRTPTSDGFGYVPTTPSSENKVRRSMNLDTVGTGQVENNANASNQRSPFVPTTPVLNQRRLNAVEDTPLSAPRTPGTPSSVRSHASFDTPGSVRNSARNGSSRFGGSTIGSSSYGGQNLENAVIWGTRVSVHEAMRSFRQFLNEYKEPNSDTPYYLRCLIELHQDRRYNLNIDCAHLYSFEETKELYNLLVRYPQEIIPIMDLIVNEEIDKLIEDAKEIYQDRRIQVRTFNLREGKKMRDLDPMDIDHLISIKGMIIRSSGIIPDLKQAHFKCTSCHSVKEVFVDRGRIEEPTSCPQCRTKYSMEIVHNMCLFTDKQMVKLQETPDSIPEGETPATITLYTFDELVDVARPGDKLEVTGIFRAVPMKVNPKRRTLKSVYRTYIDVLHFKKADDRRIRLDNANTDQNDEYHTKFEEGNDIFSIREERMKRINEMSSDPDIYRNLVNSVAPSIWEMEDVKKGILCQIVGGVNKLFGSGKCRGEINTLLCGDPGTSKSQLLGYVNKLVPRGIYTSGKGSSAVGLTAYIMKDPETKELVLESGALVLSDRGICCIDEFDKMSDSTRSVLHEVMEQQTISIAKAGIICTLNARTSILASANPVESRYNPNLSVVQNLRLPPSLLSRFDLIFLILDKPNPSTDRRLARHLVSLYFCDRDNERPEAKYTIEEVSHYLSYVKEVKRPQITKEAAEALRKGYLDLRRIGYQGSSKKIVTATPRQLESLIRLSEAHAKLLSNDFVTVENVNEAIRLINVATQKAATDPRTGRIDMDMITTGQSTSTRENIEMLQTAIADILKREKQENNIRKLSMGKLISLLKEQSGMAIEEDEVIEANRRLHDERKVMFDVHTRMVSLM